MEIERKFLVKSLPDISKYRGEEIVQGYISIKPERRIRKRNGRYFYTEKGEGTLVREEIEYEVDAAKGEALFAQVKSNLIEKIRYCIPYGKYTIELDIYGGKFEGLTVCEVEFESRDEAISFEVPDWFGVDITENKEYRNKILATKE